MIICWKLPSVSRARPSPLYSRTAHFTPGTPRTRYRSFSDSGFTSSMNWTFLSITQRSAPWMSRIWLVVFRISPQKIELCWAISRAAKLTPKTMPKYFVLSPVSIFRATQFISLSFGSSSRQVVKSPSLGSDGLAT
jgi:hypothetical protein